MNVRTINETLVRHKEIEKRKSYSLNVVSGMAAMADGLFLLVTGLAIYAYYVGWGGSYHGLYTTSIIALSISAVISFNLVKLYSVDSIFSRCGEFHKALGILSITFLVFLAIAFALKISDDFSRIWFFSWFLTSAFLITLHRICCQSILSRLSRKGLVSRNLIIVGAGEQARRLISQVLHANEPWNKVIGIFDDRKERTSSSFMEYPVLGTLDNLLNYVRKNRVDDIIITLPWNADKRIGDIVRKLGELPVHVRLGSDLAGFSHLKSDYSSICRVPMLDVVNKPLDGWRYVVKGIEDRVIGLILLILSTPLMLLIALAIKLDSKGPILFQQNRYGFNNKKFKMFKFRSMYHHPHAIGVKQAQRNDPRVTRVGAFIRQSSLDELPQLLNVLNGTMSVVGPRPHAVEHNEEYSKIICGYYARHRVKPGITGWAQVNGLRGETSSPEMMKARVEHDVYYIKNWSLLLDAIILVMTIPAVLFKKNAY